MRILSDDGLDETLPIEVVDSSDAFGPHIGLKCPGCEQIHERISFNTEELHVLHDWIGRLLNNRKTN